MAAPTGSRNVDMGHWITSPIGWVSNVAGFRSNARTTYFISPVKNGIGLISSQRSSAAERRFVHSFLQSLLIGVIPLTGAKR